MAARVHKILHSIVQTYAYYTLMCICYGHKNLSEIIPILIKGLVKAPRKIF